MFSLGESEREHGGGQTTAVGKQDDPLSSLKKQRKILSRKCFLFWM